MLFSSYQSYWLKKNILIVVHGRKSITNRFCKGLEKQFKSEMLLFIAVFFFRPVSIFLKPLDKLHIVKTARPLVAIILMYIYVPMQQSAIEILRRVFRSLRPRGRVERIENGIRIATRFAVNVNRNRDVFRVKIYCLPRCNI